MLANIKFNSLPVLFIAILAVLICIIQQCSAFLKSGHLYRHLQTVKVEKIQEQKVQEKPSTAEQLCNALCSKYGLCPYDRIHAIKHAVFENFSVALRM